MVVAEVVTTPTDITTHTLTLASRRLKLPLTEGSNRRLRTTSLVSLSGVLTTRSRPLMLRLRCQPQITTRTMPIKHTRLLSLSILVRSSLRTGPRNNRTPSHIRVNPRRNNGGVQGSTVVVGLSGEGTMIVAALTLGNHHQ